MKREPFVTLRRHAAVLVLFLTLPVALFSAPSETVVSLDLLLGNLVNLPEVNESRAALSAAQAEMESLAWRGDLNLQASPSWKGWDGGHELSAAFSLTVPVGLSGEEERRLERALIRLEAARIELDRIIFESAVSVYRLYLAAYSAKSEISVLEAEYDTARIIHGRELARYEGGEISLTDLFKAEEELRKAHSAKEAGLLEAEIALTDLFLEAGMALVNGTAFEGLLMEPPELFSLPSQLELTSIVPVRNDELNLNLARLELEPVAEGFLSSLRLSWSGDDHAASLSWSFQKPALSLSYTPPSLAFGDLPVSGGAGDTESRSSITASITLSAGIGASASLARANAAAAYEAELLKAGYAEQKAEKELLVRSAEYRSALLQTGPAGEAVGRAEKLLEAVTARVQLGMAEAGDLEAARASLLRARYGADEAERKAALAWTALLEAAGFPESGLNPLSAYITDIPGGKR
jgi:outer membrane protein TolC